jgi:hypothetical protein
VWADLKNWFMLTYRYRRWIKRQIPVSSMSPCLSSNSNPGYLSMYTWLRTSLQDDLRWPERKHWPYSSVIRSRVILGRLFWIRSPNSTHGPAPCTILLKILPQSSTKYNGTIYIGIICEHRQKLINLVWLIAVMEPLWQSGKGWLIKMFNLHRMEHNFATSINMRYRVRVPPVEHNFQAPLKTPLARPVLAKRRV